MELKAIDQINPNEAVAEFMAKPDEELSSVERHLKRKLQESGQQLGQKRQIGQRLHQEIKSVEAEMLRLEGAQREFIDMIVAMAIEKKEEERNVTAKDLDKTVHG